MDQEEAHGGWGRLRSLVSSPLVAEEKAAGGGEEKVPADPAERIRAIFPHITLDSADRRVDVEAVERPISDFITPTEDESGLRDAAGVGEKFPDIFLFAGSRFHGEDEARKYLGDLSGHVISIATFGDEVLSLSEVHAQDNGSLAWQIEPGSLPELGTKVILRLRPRWAEKPGNGNPDEPGNPTTDPATPKASAAAEAKADKTTDK